MKIGWKYTSHYVNDLIDRERNSEADSAEDQLKNLLMAREKHSLEGASSKEIESWLNTSRAKLENFKEVWETLNLNEPFPDLKTYGLAQWNSYNENWHGQRSKNGGKHGLARTVAQGGSITEATYLHNKLYGL